MVNKLFKKKKLLLAIPPTPAVEVKKCLSRNNSVTISWKIKSDEGLCDGFKLEIDDGNHGPFRVYLLKQIYFRFLLRPLIFVMNICY